MADRFVSGENVTGNFTVTHLPNRTVDDHLHVPSEGAIVTAEQAKDAINGASLIVAGLYFYRKLIEPTISESSKTTADTKQPTTIPAAALQVVGVGPLASTGRFIVGFGVTFMVLSLAEGISSDLAGYFALLIALGAILGNGTQAASDIKYQLDERNQALNKLSAEAAPDTPTVQVVSWEGADATRAKTKQV